MIKKIRVTRSAQAAAKRKQKRVQAARTAEAKAKVSEFIQKKGLVSKGFGRYALKSRPRVVVYKIVWQRGTPLAHDLRNDRTSRI